MSPRTRLSIALVLAASALAGAAPASTVCVPELLGDSASPLAYRQRGDRCEGIYAQQVGKLTLEVRSLVASFEPFDPATQGELEVAWSAPPEAGGRRVRLRALSLMPRTYYRMDAAATGGAYRWPTELLAALGLTRSDLAVAGWLELAGAGSPLHEVYLPLRIGRPAAPPPEEGYQVTFVPGERLEEVAVTLTRLDGEGRTAATLRQDEELGYGYYPSNQPTTFALGRLAGEGFYQLRISAVVRGGQPATGDLVFYHPGP
jgi:hypothetical protein